MDIENRMKGIVLGALLVAALVGGIVGINVLATPEGAVTDEELAVVAASEVARHLKMPAQYAPAISATVESSTFVGKRVMRVCYRFDRDRAIRLGTPPDRMLSEREQCERVATGPAGGSPEAEAEVRRAAALLVR